MNVTGSKKPSFGGRIGASWPPASDASGGRRFGFTLLPLHAAAERPPFGPTTTFGKRPLAMNGVVYSSNQIRKANVHVGVRSETMSLRVHDYLRSHISTVVSLRNLAFVDRYK